MKLLSLNGKYGEGKFTEVDEELYDLLNQYKWSVTINGYVSRVSSQNGKKTRIYLHRLITGASKGAYVDHIDGNKLKNTTSNLRLVTCSQNGMNRKSGNTISKYKGITFDNSTGKWRTRITKNKKIISAGSYKTELEAAKAYDLKALELFGEYARLNFPKDVIQPC
jgi:hypothetical protein